MRSRWLLFASSCAAVLAMVAFFGRPASGRLKSARPHNPTFFCAAAEDPKNYQEDWFYRLRLGPDGWLFRDNDLKTKGTPALSTVQGLVALQQALKRKGTTLILAPLPPRGLGLLGYDTAALRPYPDLQGYDPEDALRGYEAGLEPLTVAGLRVANLAAAASKTPRYFFKRDHHWTPAGAKASAEAVAEVIGSRGKRTFSNRPQALAAQLGSYGEAVAHICPQAPAKETFEQYQPPRDNPKGETLFSKTALPIALVGTSNSALPQWNFAGFLAAATGLEVLNVSLEGGGPSAPLLAYVRSQDFQERPPKVLVWEYATLFDTPADPLFYRQLLPSVAGPCKAPLAQVETATSASFPPLFEKPDARARYLRLHLSDLSQLKPRLHIAYQSGREETVTLTRSPRERNDGVFYLRFAGVPKTVNLRLAAHAKGTAQAQLCR